MLAFVSNMQMQEVAFSRDMHRGWTFLIKLRPTQENTHTHLELDMSTYNMEGDNFDQIFIRCHFVQTGNQKENLQVFKIESF